MGPYCKSSQTNVNNTQGDFYFIEQMVKQRKYHEAVLLGLSYQISKYPNVEPMYGLYNTQMTSLAPTRFPQNIPPVK